ncbi:MAG: hypothetical protein JWR72_3494 [Flavisolibacter sp.]|jgi:hypothetical protein|nr:hypothetical protein [Flavisolibacter sp.]
MRDVQETKFKAKELIAVRLPMPDVTNQSLITEILDRLAKHPIKEICWDELSNVPEVSFTVACNEAALFVKFYVSEAFHQAVYRQTNDPVFKDSCVEIFIAVDDSGGYYNFEFNSLGTCLASFGSDRNNRKKLSDETICSINRWVTWKKISPVTNSFLWELTLVLTPPVFCFNNICQFTANYYKVNFYKCGDALLEPHYLAWNPIPNPIRDFHQPAYFGKMFI